MCASGRGVLWIAIQKSRKYYIGKRRSFTHLFFSNPLVLIFCLQLNWPNPLSPLWIKFDVTLWLLQFQVRKDTLNRSQVTHLYYIASLKNTGRRIFLCCSCVSAKYFQPKQSNPTFTNGLHAVHSYAKLFLFQIGGSVPTNQFRNTYISFILFKVPFSI